MQTNLSLSDFKEIRGMRFCSVTQSMGLRSAKSWAPHKKVFYWKKHVLNSFSLKNVGRCLCKGLNVNCGSDRQDVFCLADWNSNVFYSKTLHKHRHWWKLKLKEGTLLTFRKWSVIVILMVLRRYPLKSYMQVSFYCFKSSKFSSKCFCYYQW